MKIATASEGKSLKDRISDHFSSCGYINIVRLDDETLEYELAGSIKNEGRKEVLIDAIKKEDCEALISGCLDDETFKAVADAQITRYDGTGCLTSEAVEKMNAGTLGYFTSIDSEDEKDLHHHHGESNDSCCG